MSRPRSGSPRYPSHRWEEPNFGRPREPPEQDPQMERSQRPRRGPEDYGHFQAGQRRSPPPLDDRAYRRYPAQEEFHPRRPSPRPAYEDRGFEGNLHRAGAREDFRDRSRSPHSPLRVQRERLPSETRRRSDFSERPDPRSWRGEDQERGRGEFCPQEGHQDLRFPSGERVSGERARPDPHHKRSPLKGVKRERDGHSHSGFGREGQSLGPDGFARDPRGRRSQGDFRHSGPLIVDHCHGAGDNPGPRHWDRPDRYGDHEPDSRQHRSCSRERFGPNIRTGDHGEFRGSPYRNAPDLARRDPDRKSQDGFYPKKHAAWDRPAHSGHWRGKGRTGQRRTDWTHQNPHPLEQRHPARQQRPGSGSQRDESRRPKEEQPDWKGQHQKDSGRPRPKSVEQDPTREDLDPKMPRLWLQNLRSVNHPAAEDQETLTIKVDMSRPVTLESSARLSADRQLSMDLVNVGRQRLDSLPVVQHSGTSRETSTHGGTFAEEIISLVHHVKEVYFKGQDLTLSQRFSAAPHPPHLSEPEEKAELTLDQRFSSHRGFHLDQDQPQELLQEPQRGPGDLRHNLERRRQERLEGVKVTISGGDSAPQPLVTSLSGWISMFRNQDSTTEDDAPRWSQDPGTRTKSNTGHRRGFRTNGPGRNYRRGFGPKRHQNQHQPSGPGW